jgi:hypothetical protein
MTRHISAPTGVVIQTEDYYPCQHTAVGCATSAKQLPLNLEPPPHLRVAQALAAASLHHTSTRSTSTCQQTHSSAAAAPGALLADAAV